MSPKLNQSSEKSNFNIVYLRNKSKTTKIPKIRCVAVIGDIIGSRDLGVQRPLVQTKLFKVIADCNQKYSNAILSKFIITAGDEFQGLLKQADVLPDIIWELETTFKYQIRFGIGCGILNTQLQDDAIGMDGPVWYEARDAIKDAFINKRNGGVFKGFDDNDDLILNGFARILYYHRTSFTEKQRRIVNLLRQGKTQIEVAKKLKTTRQAIYKFAKSAGWNGYAEAEKGWKVALTKYDFSGEWNRIG